MKCYETGGQNNVTTGNRTTTTFQPSFTRRVRREWAAPMVRVVIFSPMIPVISGRPPTAALAPPSLRMASAIRSGEGKSGQGRTRRATRIGMNISRNIGNCRRRQRWPRGVLLGRARVALPFATTSPTLGRSPFSLPITSRGGRRSRCFPVPPTMPRTVVARM